MGEKIVLDVGELKRRLRGSAELYEVVYRDREVVVAVVVTRKGVRW